MIEQPNNLPTQEKALTTTESGFQQWQPQMYPEQKFEVGMPLAYEMQNSFTESSPFMQVKEPQSAQMAN